jgi:hypothetical protein
MGDRAPHDAVEAAREVPAGPVENVHARAEVVPFPGVLQGPRQGDPLGLPDVRHLHAEKPVSPLSALDPNSPVNRRRDDGQPEKILMLAEQADPPGRGNDEFLQPALPRS